MSLISLTQGKPERVRFDTLVAHPQNPRVGNLSVIERSLQQNGFWGALVANRKTRHILVGNHRHRAALKQDPDFEGWVLWVDVTPEKEVSILLADNRAGDLGTYEYDLLYALLQAQAETDQGLEPTLYDESDVEALRLQLEEMAQEEAGPRAPDTPDDGREISDDVIAAATKAYPVQVGDLWVIPDGEVTHRIICGDATDPKVVARLLNGATPFLMVTDPPYGVNYDPSWRSALGDNAYRRSGTVLNDNRVDWADAYKLFPGVVAYVWHGGLHGPTVAANLVEVGFEIRSQIIWNKNIHAISRGAYHWKHEPCWYAVRKGKTAAWIGDRSQMTVWDIPVRDGEDLHGHPTQKPLACHERPLRNHEGDVYDPFGGSGTTMSAAHHCRRNSFTVELSENYTALILMRAAALGLTPKKD